MIKRQPKISPFWLMPYGMARMPAPMMVLRRFMVPDRMVAVVMMGGKDGVK